MVAVAGGRVSPCSLGCLPPHTTSKPRCQALIDSSPTSASMMLRTWHSFGWQAHASASHSPIRKRLCNASSSTRTSAE